MTHTKLLQILLKTVSDYNKNKLTFSSILLETYRVGSTPNTYTTFDIGVCKLEYKEDVLTVHLRRP
jgi:hypothetical protein